MTPPLAQSGDERAPRADSESESTVAAGTVGHCGYSVWGLARRELRPAQLEAPLTDACTLMDTVTAYVSSAHEGDLTDYDLWFT